MYIGTVLYGFCDGYFGRDNWEEKRIEAIGCDWIVAREIATGMPVFCYFKDANEMFQHIEKWSEG